MRVARRHGWWLMALAVCGAVAALRAFGLLWPLEHAIANARSRMLQHPVASDIVIVGIDARSLAALARWPWPPRHPAALIERLAAAQPRRVFFDIDFSSRSNDLDDAVLEAALAKWRGAPLVLPAFFQPASAANPEPAFTQPLERFERHVQLAAVNRRPGADGLERGWRSSWTVAGRTLPTVIDPAGRLPRDAEVP